MNNENLSLPRPGTNNSIEPEEYQSEEKGITLGDIWRMIKKHWVAAVICLFIGLAGGVAYAKGIKKPKYTSEGTIMVMKEGEDDATAARTAGIIYLYMDTGKVRTAVGEELIKKGYTKELTDKDGQLDLTNVKYTLNMPTYGSTTNTSVFIRVSATTSNKALSKDMVTAAMTITKALCDGEDKQMSATKDFLNIQSGASDSKDTSTSNAVIAMVGTLLGVIVGAAYGIIRELTNVHVSSKHELETLTGYKVIGMIPKYGDKPNESDTTSKGDR